jgi:hypothetical protein
METKEYKNDFFDGAEAQGNATSIIEVLAARGIEVTGEQRAIMGLFHSDTLRVQAAS